MSSYHHSLGWLCNKQQLSPEDWTEMDEHFCMQKLLFLGNGGPVQHFPLTLGNPGAGELILHIRQTKDDFRACDVRMCVRLDVQFHVRTSNFEWRITICSMSLLKDLECFERFYYSVSRFTWHLTLRSYWLCDTQSYLFRHCTSSRTHVRTWRALKSSLVRLLTSKCTTDNLI